MQSQSSQSKLFTYAAVGLALAAIAGWFQMGAHGLVHDLFQIFGDMVFLFAGMFWLLFGDAGRGLTQNTFPLRIISLLTLLVATLATLSALVQFGQTYLYGGAVNWIRCLPETCTAFCFALSFVLPARAHDQEVAEAAANNSLLRAGQLVLSLAMLSMTTGWLIAALKHESLRNWFAVACFAVAFVLGTKALVNRLQEPAPAPAPAKAPHKIKWSGGIMQ